MDRHLSNTPKKVVSANVVSVDKNIQPLESVVVGDKRNTLGRRLGILAIVLLVLFFSISGYVQSARNGSLLRRAAVDRSKLIDSTQKLVDTGQKIANVNKNQSELIQQLQEAIRVQNKLLRKAGVAVVLIPGQENYPHNHASHNNSGPKENPQPQPSRSPKPRPSHSPTAKPTPTSTKTPSPNTVQRVVNEACHLTGICISLQFIFGSLYASYW